MKNHYTKELLITSTYSDRFCELGLTQATLLLQDAMTELFYTYQCDAIRLVPVPPGDLGRGPHQAAV